MRSFIVTGKTTGQAYEVGRCATWEWRVKRHKIHTIKLSRRTFDRILRGDKVEIKGQGFPTEEGRTQDRCIFTTNERAEIDVRVYCDDSRDVTEVVRGCVSIHPKRTARFRANPNWTNSPGRLAAPWRTRGAGRHFDANR